MRKEFPRKVKRAVIDRAAGKCERCKAALKIGEGQVDHILEDALGGEPVIANAQLLCKVCHDEKTADRVRMMRKADRARDRTSGAIRATSKLAAPPKQPKVSTKLPVPGMSGLARQYVGSTGPGWIDPFARGSE